MQPDQPQATTPTVAPQQPVNSDNLYADICAQIILGQQEIIGELAIDQARLVPGLSVNTTSGTVQCLLNGEPIAIIDRLIAQYQDFFGHAAVEVCKEAASQLLIRLEQTQIPNSLR